MIRAEPTVEPILEVDGWKVREMVIDKNKMLALWTTFQQYQTLFSDLARGDFNNFYRVLLLPNTLWFEIWDKADEQIIGVLWVTDLEQIVDANAHCVYFDRMPAQKDNVTRELIWWLFRHFPLHRLTAKPAAIYHATIRLMERIGFKKEGRVRESVLIGGKWNDQIIYGITRPEVEAQWASSQASSDKPKAEVLAT